MAEPSCQISPVASESEKRLDSWKEIAAYLNRDVTTVQRWEKREGMPVHRHVHDKRSSVYAITHELDAWIQSRRSRVDESEPETELPSATPDYTEATNRRGAYLRFALAAFLGFDLAVVAWLVFQHRATTSVVTPIHSLAVLPLRNLSGDATQEYLADGITEALIGRLANIHDLRVISHTSVMHLKDAQLSIPQIAKTLGVDAIVEGSVMTQGDHIRVTAQLIRGATDQHFWSETYDRGISDVLSLESELAQSIADKVEVTVTGEEHQRLSSARPVAPEVYESYLKGGFALGQGNRAGDEQSIHYFEDAIRRDETFAPAYVGLARAYTNLGTVFSGVPPEATRPKVISFARKALTIDPNLSEAHVALAFVLQEEWHWTEAEAEYKRALELNPNDAQAYSWFSLWQVCQGQTDKAVASIEHARALDPVGVSGGSVAWILFQSHRYEDAIRESSSALAIQPNSAITLTGLGFALIADNKSADAIPVLEKAVSLSHDSPAATGVLIRAYAHAGRRDDAVRLLAELNNRRKTGYVPSGAFVNAYLGLDDKEQAFYWLEQAYKEQSNILQFLNSHPYFDPIREDRRFADLVRRVDLKETSITTSGFTR
ncbi:TolB-like protein/Tfp pilus assembly protein PilF [Granulicella aggregans]|uniref:TolB-like protein/Tfp pilus assembly protein PilF n=1 Tax=Granulicella aggregans TaxID=474949 RepID=A0A7W7ZIC2_9BACT|nr:tetratricopeptide repeat protein [Granulicella aggregans]MBB5060442.1 TolB-like protein/Tfp pilus assembly protein PilF [Granulicella aggregans]